MTASLIRQQLLAEIQQERERQLQLPGSEFDAKHSENDWIAISSKYLTESASRKHQRTDTILYRDNLIKSAAVILAALEHLDQKRTS